MNPNLNKCRYICRKYMNIIYPLVRGSCSLVTKRAMSSQFPSLPSVLPPSQRLVWVDCEMTGLQLETDKLLEIAVIVTEGDTLQQVGRAENIIIHADDEEQYKLLFENRIFNH